MDGWRPVILPDDLEPAPSHPLAKDLQSGLAAFFIFVLSRAIIQGLSKVAMFATTVCVPSEPSAELAPHVRAKKSERSSVSRAVSRFFVSARQPERRMGGKVTGRPVKNRGHRLLNGAASRLCCCRKRDCRCIEPPERVSLALDSRIAY